MQRRQAVGPARSRWSAAIADDDVAVPADFEDEAAKTITAATYKSELESLEKSAD